MSSHQLSPRNLATTTKPYKFLLTIPATVKVTDIFTSFMKAFFAIVAVASISLLSFNAIPSSITTSHVDPSTTVRVSDSTNGGINFQPNYYQETNVSHILFGIGGSAKMWEERRHYCELWWKPNTTRGFVWLDEPPQENTPWPESSPQYRVSEDTTRFQYTCWYGSRSAIRIARIIKESFQLGLKDVRWFVMGDDDTVFFIENLLTVLRKYDHKEMYYIGSNSESVEQDLIHSYTMAYGGGGFAISYPLAEVLVRVLDGCIDRYSSAYGSDEKIGGCMAEIGVPLTRELGFHQVDIRGDPYGLLAAHPLVPLVSLHHQDYLQPIFPGLTQVESTKKLIQSYQLDPSRLLQQSFCYDLNRNWSFSISWGYTAQLYPSLVTAKELITPFQTFTTWRTWSAEPFSFNTRVLSQEPCERPIIYFLDGPTNMVNSSSGESTRTMYKKVEAEPGKECIREDYGAAASIKTIKVSAAILDASVWTKGQRRQCCEVVNGNGGEEEVLKIKIRNCKRRESVSPP
ncbi:uncharacterized protein LOC124937484 [Impatiens glandulifera]|uniref:uncharacterized protein LOC124937484 n=1 Tax=Impatiens glandulifera TaxID=253017 RepID=UPI001FB058A9|nr:uncharacterized protein LOC124937484 [Impatiens glandulifera]